MYEIEFIGRGGQGVKTAAEIVARQAMKKGFYVQSFPDYGPERKGAPVRAFTRLSLTPIRGCSSEANSDIVVVMDQSLLSLKDAFFNLNENTLLLVNSAKNPEELKSELKINCKVYTINATSIALKYFKSARTNTPMLGALSRIVDYYTLDELKKEIEEEFTKKLTEEEIQANILATEEAYMEVKKPCC